MEKFALPKPLFCEDDVEDYGEEADTIEYNTENTPSNNVERADKHLSMSSADSVVTRSRTPDSLHSMRSSLSPVSTPESPAKTNAKPHIKNSQKPVPVKDVSLSSTTKKSRKGDASESGVPPQLRSLYNYILWRVQQEIDPAAALESFIFLCDDPIKAKLAQRFGIRVKSLADIRFVVAREEREFRNRQLVQRKENEKSILTNGAGSRPSTRGSAIASPVVAPVEDDVSDEDDEVVFKRPPKAPAAMIAAQQQKSPRPKNKVLDPNQFSRNAGGRGNTRGGAARASAGGRGGARGSVSTSNVGAARSDLTQDTSNGTGPIDPDSFSRPSPAGNRFRGGGGRKLFVPT